MGNPNLDSTEQSHSAESSKKSTYLGLGMDALFVFQAIVLCFFILLSCDVIPPWFSTGLPQRAQTDALLRGKLSLSDNPADLALVPYDLCWSEGGVQQVWGLGIPIWRLPFEMLARLCNQEAFSDRVALGLFMAMVAYMSFKTWFGAPLHPNGNGHFGEQNRGTTVQILVGIGAITLSMLFAPVINILRSPMGHYEEVLVYVHFYAVALALGIIALYRNPRKSLFLVVCAFAGLSGLMRPTMLSYGAATVLAASLIVLFRKAYSNPACGTSRPGSWPILSMGICLFALGGGMLLLTNLLRFGSGLEFGHSLNLSPALPLLYMERIGNPFAHVPWNEAARELFGFLFLTHKFNGTGWYDQGLFPGQSSVIRWRMIDLTTYDLSYISVLAIAWGIGIRQIWLCLRRFKTYWKSGRDDSLLPHPGVVLIAWSLISAATLAIFYLKIPMIASRYMIDFAPAFAMSLIGLLWWGIEFLAKYGRFGTIVSYGLCLVVVIWQGREISKGQSGWGRPRSLTEGEATTQMQPKPLPVKEIDCEYRIGDSMDSWGIPYNGEGWNAEDGHVWSLAIFFIKDPQFIELKISDASTNNVANVSITDIRAKIGLEFLERDSIERTNNEWLVRFKVPKQRRYQHGLQTLFIATVPTSELANYVVPPTPWILKRIRWIDSKTQ